MSFTELRTRAEERLAAPRLNVDDVADADVRFIADVLNTLEALQEKDAEDTSTLHELLARRATAALADWPNRHAAAAAVTTDADIDAINTMCRERGTFAALLASSHTDVWEDFRVGGRCAVCAMTPAQAAAENYDCVREC